MDRQTIYEQMVEKKQEWIGGELQELTDSYPRVIDGCSPKTKIIDITLTDNGGNYPFFMIHGENYDCGFATDVGGVMGMPGMEEGWLCFSGYGGHEFRIKQALKEGTK